MSPLDTIVEALRDYVGDGDGADEKVLAEYTAAIKEQAWDECMAYVHSEIKTYLDDYRKKIGPGTVMASDTQPVFDAINAAGTRFTYSSYNAHISWATAYSLLDWLTVHPPIFDDDGTELYEGDEEQNPYRAARLEAEET